MTTAKEFWSPIINAFNPVGQIRPEDVTRFYVDRKQGDQQRSRVQRLKVSLITSTTQNRPYKALLTGHVGCGKSSELMRLGQELANDFFVVWFDAEYTLFAETANQFDIIYTMGLAVHATAEAARLKPDRKKIQALEESLSRFVRKYVERDDKGLKWTELIGQVFALTFSAGAGLAGNAVAGVPGAIAAGAFVAALGQGILKATRVELNISDEQVRTLELPQNRREVIGALNGIIEEVVQKAGKPVVIITDGLDKVPTARALKLFVESALLTEPACGVIYTAPIEFHHRLEAGGANSLFNNSVMLNNPPVHHRPPTGEDWQQDRDPNDDGVEVMRRVIAKRLEACGKKIDEVISPAAMDYLARMSGGVMRELIRYFQDAATSAQIMNRMEIDEEIAREVIDDYRADLELRLREQDRQSLRAVLQNGRLGSDGETEATLLRNLLLLSYQERSGAWFDANPLALPLIK